MSQSIETQKRALQVLINAVELACKRGAYSIAEAANLHEAIQIFQSSEPSPKATQLSSQQNLEKINS